jgi:eukaryotic-like serine/threonine-protein kinase
MPAQQCQHCGQAIDPSFEGSADSTVTTPPAAAPTVPPNSPPADPQPSEDDSAKVVRLLQHIASQSHFEDRYEVRGVLDRGGMGQIFRAYDRIIRREVAIKMMPDESARHFPWAAIQGQFLKEARIGGRLLHPNVLAVFDLGVNRSGQIYYTMRLVNGASLQNSLEYLEKGVLTNLIAYPLPKIIRALLGACHGIDYAHQNRIIHLDLKPQNIMMSGFREVFVIDWGLARIDEIDDTDQILDLYRERQNSGTTSLTFADGPIVGTPAYMAPEQADGESRSYDATTDIYGLGGILYFILYGTPPNRGQTTAERLAASLRPKERGDLRPGILPRGERVPQATQAAIEALESICLRALEVNQDKRYPCVENLIIDLNDWLSRSTQFSSAD